jgi:pyruvate dehydrogenase E2 component (dihydrolipoamide acetyltransferase)
MEEGRLVRWLKPEGATVASGDVLAEVETDKAIMELVARGEGILRKQLVAEGATAPIGTLLGVIAGPNEDITTLIGAAAPAPGTTAPPPAATANRAAAAPPTAASATAPPAAAPTTAAPAVATPASAVTANAAPSGVAESIAAQAGAGGDAGRLRSSPLARRLAAERGVD